MDADSRVKQHARSKGQHAIQSGRLVRPTTCPLCGSGNYRIEAHHEDYLKPLEIVWCCGKCHVQLDRARLLRLGLRRKPKDNYPNVRQCLNRGIPLHERHVLAYRKAIADDRSIVPYLLQSFKPIHWRQICGEPTI